MKLTLRSAVATFGSAAKSKLSNPAATGEPEDQLRAPLEHLFKDMAELVGLPRQAVDAVGESSISALKTRPDYAVVVHKALVGFVEVKAPGKGADPRRFKDRHDKDQWDKLQSLPNLLYTDGNAFSLWRSGDLVGSVVRLAGDVETSGEALDAPADLLRLFDDFLGWQPIPPRDAKQLADTTARLCRLLRAEVTEQLALGSPALTALAKDWRMLLFPEATDAQFADGYAQAVTFGMLMARARGIALGTGLYQAAEVLGETNSLIGTALRVLTHDAGNQKTLKTSLETLVRVLDAVHWDRISKGDPDAWLYFYENFLAVYDNDLRKQTGSYYTPPEVVSAMVRLVDEVLRSPDRFDVPAGLASPKVCVCDPAVGTGTFPLGVFRHVAAAVEADQGKGAVRKAVLAAVKRIVGFELQLGPFAVAQLRVLAELAELTGHTPDVEPRMYVTDTLGDPYVEQEWLPAQYGPIGESRRQANVVKAKERIWVVIGNPPYKEKAKGRGGWVESGGGGTGGPMLAWMPPREWDIGTHARHLHNLYVYFWRWATWKVFDQAPAGGQGIVCFITVAGFLNGPGFARMRDYLRRACDKVWVIDCSPEGHQPETNTRIFQGVQQPICIVMASRSPRLAPDSPAAVRYRVLPSGHRDAKLESLRTVSLGDDVWAECGTGWRDAFLPASAGAWLTYPEMADLFVDSTTGVMVGRTWVIAPDEWSLTARWKRLVNAHPNQQEDLFLPHLNKGKLGDRHVGRVVKVALPGHEARPMPIAEDKGACVRPTSYAFRSFDRQFIIPDNRLINRASPELWSAYSGRQVFLTAPEDRSPTSGPSVSFTALMPDVHHYAGRGGRVYALWSDAAANVPNVRPNLPAFLTKRYGRPVTAEDVLAYVAAVAAHPAYTARFKADLVTPGLRVPFTADAQTFADAVVVGREVVWLHTFGERFADPAAGRPGKPPRVAGGKGPTIPADGEIGREGADFPNTIDYDPATNRLLVGEGYIDRVPPAVWAYEVSGKQVLRQWFSYRKRDRDRPIMGARRRSSARSSRTSGRPSTRPSC